MTPASLFLLTSRLILTAAAAGGFLAIEPPKLVVEYGAPASANCSTNISHHGIGWETSQDPIPMKTGVQFLTWKVESVTHYDLKPICYINAESGQTQTNLQVTGYKIPDWVSISLKDQSGHLIKGRSYTLKCDVQGVAPVQSLVVNWYRNDVFENRLNFSGATPFLVNVSAELQIEARRSEDGATYRCEAELELGAQGPEVPPTKKSVPLSVSVHYEPKFSNQTEIVFQDHKENIILNCTVISNPPPVYTWNSTHLEQERQGPVLVLKPKSSGNYMCRASNPYGQDEKVYIIKERLEGPGFPTWAAILIAILVLLLLLLAFLGFAFYKREKIAICLRSLWYRSVTK